MESRTPPIGRAGRGTCARSLASCHVFWTAALALLAASCCPGYHVLPVRVGDREESPAAILWVENRTGSTFSILEKDDFGEAAGEGSGKRTEVPAGTRRPLQLQAQRSELTEESGAKAYAYFLVENPYVWSGANPSVGVVALHDGTRRVQVTFLLDRIDLFSPWDLARPDQRPAFVMSVTALGDGQVVPVNRERP